MTRVGENSITMLDVKKEMDRQIFIHNKVLFANAEALAAYYTQNWKPTLKKIIEDEVLLLEAENLKYDIPSTEITKKLHELYGDDVVPALQFLQFSEEKAKKHAKREVISSHLSWFQIWSKSVMSVTPKKVHERYGQYVKDLEGNDKWTYQTIYVKDRKQTNVVQATESIQLLLKKNRYENLSSLLDNLPFTTDLAQVKVSKDITLKSNEISSNLLSLLKSVEEGMNTKTILSQKGQTHTGKILHLIKHEKAPIPSYKDSVNNLKNSLVSVKGEKRAQEYFANLYQKYDVSGFYGQSLLTYNEPIFTID